MTPPRRATYSRPPTGQALHDEGGQGRGRRRGLPSRQFRVQEPLGGRQLCDRGRVQWLEVLGHRAAVVAPQAIGMAVTTSIRENRRCRISPIQSAVLASSSRCAANPKLVTNSSPKSASFLVLFGIGICGKARRAKGLYV